MTGTSRVEIRRRWLAPVLVFATLLPIYLLTNVDWAPQNRDTVAQAVGAWRLATHGDLDVTQFKDWLIEYHDGEVSQVWYVDTGDRLTSNRPPGASFWAVPFYWASGASPDEVTLAPASVAASVAVALAMAVLVLVFRQVVDERASVGGALIAGLATPAWGVASDALWQHSVSILFLALGMLSMARERNVVAGWFAGLAVFTRPLSASIAAIWGLMRGWQERSWRPVLAIGIPSLAGAAALTWYNLIAFDTASPTGGYGSYPIDGLVANNPIGYAENVLRWFLGGDRGIFVYTPFLIVLAGGAWVAWNASPGWVKVSGVSAVVYTLLQLRVNRYSGGGVWLSYRLPLEPLMVSAPLLVVSYARWVRSQPFWSKVFWVTVVISVGIQINAALFWIS